MLVLKAFISSPYSSGRRGCCRSWSICPSGFVFRLCPCFLPKKRCLYPSCFCCFAAQELTQAGWSSAIKFFNVQCLWKKRTRGQLSTLLNCGNTFINNVDKTFFFPEWLELLIYFSTPSTAPYVCGICLFPRAHVSIKQLSGMCKN